MTQAEQEVIDAARGYVRDVASMDARGRAAAFDRLVEAIRALEQQEEAARAAMRRFVGRFYGEGEEGAERA